MEINETLVQRGKEYGDYAFMAEVAQALKQELLYGRRGQLPLSPDMRESLDVICTKLARIVCGNPSNIDSWDDIAGYALLVARRLRIEQGRAQVATPSSGGQPEAARGTGGPPGGVAGGCVTGRPDGVTICVGQGPMNKAKDNLGPY